MYGWSDLCLCQTAYHFLRSFLSCASASSLRRPLGNRHFFGNWHRLLVRAQVYLCALWQPLLVLHQTVILKDEFAGLGRKLLACFFLSLGATQALLSFVARHYV